MVPFSIGGIQMHVSAAYSNIELMKHKIEVMTSVYPWVQMIVLSELCAHGPLTHHAKPFPNEDEKIFQDLAKKHNIWLIPGSMFKKEGEKKYNQMKPVIDKMEENWQPPKIEEGFDKIIKIKGYNN
jgi:predicted amidohydrolase